MVDDPAEVVRIIQQAHAQHNGADAQDCPGRAESEPGPVD